MKGQALLARGSVGTRRLAGLAASQSSALQLLPLCAKPLGLALTKVHLFGSLPTSRRFVCFLGKKLGSFVQLFTCTKRHAYKSRLLLPSAASTSLSMTKSRSSRRYNEGCASN